MPVNSSAFLILSRGAMVLSHGKGKTVEEHLSNTPTYTESARPSDLVTPLGAMMQASEEKVPWVDVTFRDVAAPKYGCCTAQEAEKIHRWQSRIVPATV
eukprot:CAMPEP_0180158498 /NCGR_PEP_ID=MMETSP0986-20121125/26940_1 /TAXON_ID=697907 /ORGANISM="non described non described, Strain CCMP2293" /LENGTH=98 /DNA_ID=CAMNT_0022108355 /DNA_START=47 /DNA_END=343 /DNA_ORIENTATION=+